MEPNMRKERIKKYPFRRIGKKEWRRLEAEAMELFGVIEDGVWYPNERFIEEIHLMVLKETGGYEGYDTGISILKLIIDQMKETKNIYMKASILLRQLIVRPCIYDDGNHRTALITTGTFLRKNGREIYTKDMQETNRFIKDILKYSYDEVAEWLENGFQRKASN